MDAEDSPIHADHIGITYHFCSQQCRENFLDRPKLYVGIHAVRRAGREVVKHRTFLLDHPVEGIQPDQVIHALKQLMGVRDVRVNGREICITYDLLEATAEQLEQAISEVGARLGSGWAARLKHGWMHYSEENELDNLEAGEPACCNRPPAKG